MSIDAGCTHLGSNGSMPIRPASIAARMSRSERTTTTEYAGLPVREREHRAAKLGPRPHALLGIRKRRRRVAPQDLDGVRARGATHRDVRRTVADDDGLLR